MAMSNLVAYAFEWETRSSIIFKLCMDHQGLKIYKGYINDDPGLTLTYLTARSTLLIVALYQTNSQVNVYRLIGPLVVVVRSQCSNIFSYETTWPFIVKLQIGASLGRGNKCLYKW